MNNFVQSWMASQKVTFTASIGLRAISAKNSAEAEDIKYSQVRYKKAFSSPMKLPYFTLKTSYNPNLKNP